MPFDPGTSSVHRRVPLRLSVRSCGVRIALVGRGFDVIHACNPPETSWIIGRFWRLFGAVHLRPRPLSRVVRGQVPRAAGCDVPLPPVHGAGDLPYLDGGHRHQREPQGGGCRRGRDGARGCSWFAPDLPRADSALPRDESWRRPQVRGRLSARSGIDEVGVPWSGHWPSSATSSAGRTSRECSSVAVPTATGHPSWQASST